MRINGVDYAVQMTGHGEPLVLLHGFTGSSKSWGPHVPLFSVSYTVVTIDLLGHGRTTSPADPARYEITRAAADLHALLRACGVDAPHLLGYSMGGRLALCYALQHPVRSLLLESASPGLVSEQERAARRESDERLAARIEQDGIPAFVDTWEKLPLFVTQAALPEDVRARQRQQRQANNPTGLANSLRGMGTGAQPSFWGRLSLLDAPALLLVGALDEKFTAIAQTMAGKMRSARLAVISGAGHAPHLEQPTSFRDEVLRFVRDIGRRRLP
ncbi:MAG: 2-succinyl-6-hydroxy-2,4-cyclohexadiene-1-carboxylate synthase [Anaerolineae bacterium]|nr:2-succinyl-6-hydroxy-2,4-cyclohexadiene-1-carboxylate synthase [Anaerolineae bacterium]NUQ02431.1 2-succinyl-6-hydroxy-2,4-cyclohexadiene-1-carboxylate synthase [Anaerolineae bacterium]